YFESEWSYAQVRGIETPSICAFGQEPYSIFVIGKDGSFLRANFKNGGEAERVSYNRFLKSADEVLKVDNEVQNLAAAAAGGEGEDGDEFVNVEKAPAT
ncbi:hypothetical protein TeGR_g374, partial [Tetraparma gracilis]